MSKYGVFSGPHFPAFGLNTGKYGLEKTPYFDTFYVVHIYEKIYKSAAFHKCITARLKS